MIIKINIILVLEYRL